MGSPQTLLTKLTILTIPCLLTFFMASFAFASSAFSLAAASLAAAAAAFFAAASAAFASASARFSAAASALAAAAAALGVCGRDAPPVGVCGRGGDGVRPLPALGVCGRDRAGEALRAGAGEPPGRTLSGAVPRLFAAAPLVVSFCAAGREGGGDVAAPRPPLAALLSPTPASCRELTRFCATDADCTTGPRGCAVGIGSSSSWMPPPP